MKQLSVIALFCLMLIVLATPRNSSSASARSTVGIHSNKPASEANTLCAGIVFDPPGSVSPESRYSGELSIGNRYAARKVR